MNRRSSIPVEKHRKRTIWTDDKLSELTELIKQHKTGQEIADHFHIAPGAVYSAIYRYELPKISHNRKIRVVALLRRMGWSRKRCAAHFGITESAIGNIIDRSTVPRQVHREVTSQELEIIMEMKASGAQYYRIAAKLGGEPDWTTQRVNNVYNYYRRKR